MSQTAWEPELLETAEPGCEEIHVTRGEVSLCLILNRRTRVMRIIDFRAGTQAKKLDLIREVGIEQGIERAFTVVEREESSTWAKMGFAKEGNIPGFYKRSDAYLMGLTLDSEVLRQSGSRIRIAPVENEVTDRAERVYQAARKLVRNRNVDGKSRAKVALAREQDVEKAFATAERSGRALTGLERFGRDVEKKYYLCTARGGFSLLVGVESQPCFDNAFIEALSAPRGDKETWLAAESLDLIGEDLMRQGIVSAFAITPVESVELAAVMLGAGFRRTGRMIGHMVVAGERVDACVWSRRLAEPA